MKIYKQKAHYDILYWFVGFNSAFYSFRVAFPILNILYGLCMGIIATRAIWRIIIRRRKKSSSIFYLKFLIYFISLILSISYSFEFFMKTLTASISILLLYICRLESPDERDWKSFLLGYKVSLMIDFIYAGVQLLVVLVSGYNINIVLYKIISMEEHNLSDRISGLVSDPFVIGLFCATGFFIFRSKLIKIYLLVLLIFSQSRSGLVGLICAAVYYYWPIVKKKQTFILAVCVFIAGIIVIPNVFDLSRGFNSKSVGYVRIEYITLLPKILASDNNILRRLFGGSPVYTGAKFYFSNINSMVKRLNRGIYWIIESDWFGIVYGQGIIGSIIYFSFYIWAFRKQKNRLYRALIMAVFFAGIGYNYDTAIFSTLLVYLPMCKMVWEKNGLKR